MSHNITPLDEFTTAITVPDDGDQGFASSVETFVQALANRTKYLRDRLAPETPASFQVMLPLSGLRPSNASAPTFGASCEEVTVAQNTTYWYPITGLFRLGTNFTTVSMVYSSSVAPGSGTTIQMISSEPDFVTPGPATASSGFLATSANVTGAQLISMDPGAALMSAAATSLKIVIANVAATHKILGLAIYGTDAEYARNF